VRLDEEGISLDALARRTAELVVGGARLFVCGDSSSAAVARQLADEVSECYRAEDRTLPALALPADGTLLACMENDSPADTVFARQLEGLGQPGDLLIVLSTGGPALSLIAVLETAQRAGLHTLALLSQDGGGLAGRAECEERLPSDDPARLQEAYRGFIHAVGTFIEDALHAA
jgi:D-sedoheptulose 7-phosphate isomerase